MMMMMSTNTSSSSSSSSSSSKDRISSSWIVPFLLGSGVTFVTTVGYLRHRHTTRQNLDDYKIKNCKNDNDDIQESNESSEVGEDKDVISASYFNSSKDYEPWIRLVVQRARKASLVVTGTDDVSMPEQEDSMIVKKTTDDYSSVGLVVYVSFSNNGDNLNASNRKKDIMMAAKVVLNLPVLTTGEWGDGSKPISVLKMASEQYSKKSLTSVDLSMSTCIVEYVDVDGGDIGGYSVNTLDKRSRNNCTRGEDSGGVFVMVVPQANLICKAKSNGKSLQYHQQIDKQKGEESYENFTKAISLLSLEQQYKHQGQAIPPLIREEIKAYSSSQFQNQEIPVSCPPDQILIDKDLYSSWDRSGFPLTNIRGESLSKSKIKKLRKHFEQQKIRYENYLKREKFPKSKGSITSTSKLASDKMFIDVITGTFGKLQALEISSDMGPFCHVFDL